MNEPVLVFVRCFLTGVMVGLVLAEMANSVRLRLKHYDFVTHQFWQGAGITVTKKDAGQLFAWCAWLGWWELRRWGIGLEKAKEVTDG